MNEQKKNKVLRVAGLALVLTLITTCLLAHTLAKYTTSVSGTDTARVAKWGWSATTTTDIFQTSYENSSSKLTVETNASDKIVAPGTSGEVTITPTGTSEVATKLTYTVSETNASGIPIIYEYDGKYYTSSTRYTADGSTQYQMILANDGTTKTALALQNGGLTALQTALTAASTTIAPNATVASTDSKTIKWYWAYEVYDAAGELITATDISDTTLGSGGTATVKLNVGLTATQVD